ncbi:hypothetical protein KDL29_05045 [bacterium]|nr:hypothetical protein [bacterium]
MTGWTGKLPGILAGMIVVGLLAAGSGCGSTMQGDTPALDSSRGTARAVSLGEAIQQVDALPAPEGVNPALFQQLQDELVRVLQAQGVERFVSDAPQSQGSAVNDLMITNNQDGSADLAWTYRNQGDGDLNSEVNIADLTPIGIHLGKSGASADWNKARNTDNDGNNEVNISDITPIGSNFLKKVQGYWIQRAVNPDSTWNLVSQVVFADSSINSESFQRDFTFHLNVPADGQYYRVAPYDGSSIGIPSNFVQAESFTLPGKPGNVSATQGTLLEQVDLSWDPVADAEYYEIQRRTGTLGSFEHLFDSADATTGYSNTDVVTGQHYFYIVRGWQGEKKTDFSIQFEGWPLDRPAMPTNLMASDGTSPDHVSVSWDAADGADEYVLYHSLEENGTYTELLRTTELSYDDTAAALESLNWYYVTASNTAGESNPSNKDSGYRDGAVPVIDSVSPLAGLSGDSIQMLAVTSGASVNGYSWDFGGGATPDTSTDESPMITLGAPGVYDCSLTVDGNLDSDTFDFQLTVTTDEWVHTIGGATDDDGFTVGTDSSGNVYVIGRTDYPTVAKFSPAGQVIWARKYETGRDFEVVSGKVDASGNVFVAAGLGDRSTLVPSEGVLVFGIDTDGNLIYERLLEDGGALNTFHNPRTALDGSGNFYVVFSLWDEIEIKLTNMVVYKLQPNGTVIWNKYYVADFMDVGHSNKHAEGITADAAGNLYAAGNEACVVKIASNGDVDWCKGWGDGASIIHEHGYNVAVDGNGDVFLSGGANTLGDYQPFIVKFQSDGTVLWQKGYSVVAGATSGHITHLYVDVAGNVYGLNPHLADEGLGAASRFYAVDPSGTSIGTWEYTPRSDNLIVDMIAVNDRFMFAGTGKNIDGSWSKINETVDDYSLSLDDRTVTIAPTTGSSTNNNEGNLIPYTDFELDSSGTDTDLLVMSLRTTSLPE